jgi:hypothetical protein
MGAAAVAAHLTSEKRIREIISAVMRSHHAVRALILAVLLAVVSAGAQTRRPAKPAPKAAPKASAPAEQTKPTEAEKTPIPGQSRRLVLKDGSFQDTVRWERKGDRVRYLSSERYEWEELPSSLVDWAATEKYAKERTVEKPRSADVEAVDAEEAAERKKEEARSPEILPGLRLPMQGGVYLLDYWRDQPQIIELVQNGGDINRNTGRNILRAAINPLAKAKQTIELKGPHARVQAHVPQPAVYVNIDLDQNSKTGLSASDISDHFRIVKVATKKDGRVVGNIEVAIYGKVTQKADYIQTRAEPFTSEWVKVTPVQALDPGEYALVEMLGKDVNLYVWDFGINPTAPENPASWKPAPVKDTSTGTKESPVLNKRPPKD